MRKVFKKFLKNNKYVLSIITILLYWYLRFVYFTSKQKFIFYDNGNKEKFLNEQGVIFAFWHNMLALSPSMFIGHRNIYALISPHLDGKILKDLVGKFGCRVIVGSTNKNPIGALRNIIGKLSQGANIIVTPDGPKGPVYKVNSGITEIAYRYNTKLITIVSSTSRCFRLKSWDKLIIPLPFGTIKIIVGSPLELTNDKIQNHISLEKQLASLTESLKK
ncbi:lysophospholipid acyltransferase family protein [Rickettsia honei]|uniref:lysophospholipid acyltransferase family protein n=1 Tax=Rickettsia honei TaxID=37816 RepID=UPI0002F35ABD|nr:lysophospholipid acyltransferase family protein [Rickettsia honei]